MLHEVQKFLKGVDKFYSNFQRRETKAKLVWQQGSTKILKYNSDGDKELPILFFIPSLINKSYIFDLDADSSMIQYFTSLNYRVFLVDFNEPLENELNMGFKEYLNRIENALTTVCSNEPTIVVGYCLGGVFSYHLKESSNIIGKILIATPWKFDQFKQILGLNNSLILDHFISIISNVKKVSPSLVQWFFSSIDPYKLWNKFTNFSQMQKEDEITKFVNVEQWLNDGISLSRSFALDALALIKSNKLNHDRVLKNISNTECLIINGTEDKIVPFHSSISLCPIITQKTELQINTGHIGLIVSKIAKKEVWPRIDDWIKKLLILK